ncbi:hypothetical protein K488DRAFT_88939 [Vararia minispora EC-137]|uniref:Uncharacterized protein n=1 Tax=Vararia minispora EC-137 TaxID=1314806 RepID=A0ACB8QD76_9AGAM|nr:hypothetical protein K488DRAFT_88939 [Vararia minispora EC-137]
MTDSSYPVPVAQDASRLPSHSDQTYPAGPDTSGNIFYVPFRKPGLVVFLVIGVAALAILAALAAYSWPIIRAWTSGPARTLNKSAIEKPSPRRRVIVPMLRASSRSSILSHSRQSKSLDLSRPPTVTLSYIPSSPSDLLAYQGAKALPKLEFGPPIFAPPSPGSRTSTSISPSSSVAPSTLSSLRSAPLGSSETLTLKPSNPRDSMSPASSFLTVPVWRMGRETRLDDAEAQREATLRVL